MSASRSVTFCTIKCWIICNDETEVDYVIAMFIINAYYYKGEIGRNAVP